MHFLLTTKWHILWRLWTLVPSFLISTEMFFWAFASRTGLFHPDWTLAVSDTGSGWGMKCDKVFLLKVCEYQGCPTMPDAPSQGQMRWDEMKWMRWVWRNKKNLPRPSFIHNETHMVWPRRDFVTPAVGGERLTACTTRPVGLILTISHLPTVQFQMFDETSVILAYLVVRKYKFLLVDTSIKVENPWSILRKGRAR